MANFIPYGKQSIEEDDIQSVVKILNSDFLTQGPTTSKFENLISTYVNSEYAVTVNSATSGLHLACLALGLKDKDIVWTSPNTFVSSANCALYCNALIDFVDIDISTGLMSINKLEEKLKVAKSQNKLPKILIPVHLAGSSCDMKKIYELSLEYEFKIIEDASHAMGGKYQKYKVGSCKYSDITIFSFHPVKIITTGEGGVATTNNIELADKMIQLRAHGITKDKNKFISKSSPPWHYEQHFLGFNYRMNDIQAALGISQLSKVDKFVKKRNELREEYIKNISNEEIKFLEIPKDVYSALHLLVIRINNISEKKHIEFFKNLRKCGIGVQLHYKPVHLQPYYINLGFKKNDFPVAEKYATSALSIPLFPKLKQEELIYVVNSVEKITKSILF